MPNKRCRICGKSFKRSKWLLNHMARKHPNKRINEIMVLLKPGITKEFRKAYKHV